MRKVVLFGLDGACLSFLAPLLSSGKLPNLKKLVDNGISCNLESVIPYWTAPAWVSLYCGKNPGKHGVFDFFKYRKDTSELELGSSKDIHSRCIWDYLSEYDLFSIVVNAPLTHPVHEINGVMIPGYLAPEEPICYPKGILEEIESEIGDYRVYSKFELDQKVDAVTLLTDYIEVERMRRDASIYLMDKYDWDFLFVQFQKTDSIFHDIEYRRGTNLRMDMGKIRTLYSKVDEFIGDILDHVKGEVNVVIASDHGTGRYQGWDFYMNTWLRNEGLVRTTKAAMRFKLNESKRNLKGFESNYRKTALDFLAGMLGNLGITVQRTERILSFLRLDGYFATHFTDDTISLLRSENVDWGDSAVFCRSKTDCGIRLNVKDHEYNTIRDDLIFKLEKLEGPEGERLFKVVLPREAVYIGERCRNAPDIIFEPNHSNIRISTQIRNKTFYRKPVLINHNRLGMLVANGPEFKRSGMVTIVPSSLDVAPTILHLLGVPIDKDMDGRVLYEFLENEKPAVYREYSPHQVDTLGDEADVDRIRDRLKILGYI